MKPLICIVFAAFVFAGAAFGQTDVRVTNKVGDAVAVKSVDNPARHSFQVSFELNGATPPPAIPAGKVFAVEHISGHMRIPSATGSTTPCKFYQLSFVLGSVDIDVVPVSMGTAPSIGQDLNFITISQSIKAYVQGGSDYGAASFNLSPGCSGFPTSSNIVLTGYLVNG